MGFRTGSYAKVWEVKPGATGKSVDIRIGISRKNKETDQYEQSFGGFVRCIGPAATMAMNLHEGDRIKLGEVDVDNRYDREEKKTYVNFKMFSFEMADSAPSNASPSAVEDSDPGSMPW